LPRQCGVWNEKIAVFLASFYKQQSEGILVGKRRRRREKHTSLSKGNINFPTTSIPEIGFA
jgi:hypothetical protein